MARRTDDVDQTLTAMQILGEDASRFSQDCIRSIMEHAMDLIKDEYHKPRPPETGCPGQRTIYEVV